MGRLNHHSKERIVKLKEEGYKPSQILRILESEGVKLSRVGLWKFLQRFKQNQTLSTVAPRRKESVPMAVLEMQKNDELTSPGLRNLIEANFGLRFSFSKVKRLRRKLGWLATGSKYCQLVREANQPKRLEFAQRCLENSETFDDVIFTDESSIQMEWHGKITFHHWWEPPRQKGVAKHPYKVHVWAGISKRGATAITIFTGCMDAAFFVDTILTKALLPFISSHFPEGHRFQQDNFPKHTSNLAKSFFEDKGVNWWRTPPESPDLNPIELVWHELKHHLRANVKPRTKEALVESIKQFWAQAMTVEKCKRYINHIKKYCQLLWNVKDVHQVAELVDANVNFSIVNN